MILPRKIRDIALCAALLAIPIAFLHANLKSPGELNPLDRVLLRISAPIQAAVTASAAGVHRAWNRYVFLVGVEQDNAQLRQENRRLRSQLKQVQRQAGRARRCEQLLNFREARQIETIGVRVIARDASPFVRILRMAVDRGSGALRPGLPVVSADGVVGRVERVFGSYSDVMLAVDPRSAIDVIIRRTGGRGLLRGIEGTNRYLCRVDYLLHKEEVKVGDLVVTSGVAVFPKDLPVGRISRVTRRTYGLYQEVEVTPTVDFAGLEEALVILAPPPPPASRNSPSREPARGFVP